MDEQFFAARGRRGVRHGQRDAEQGVGPEPALVRRAVERDQLGVERRLDRPGPCRATAGAITRVTLSTALSDAQSAIATAVGVAQLECLVPARARPRGDDRPPDGPVEAIASTSTVGRPRESSTWRAFSAFNVAMSIPPADRIVENIAQNRPMSPARSASASRANDRAMAWPRASRYSTGLLPSTRARQHAAACRMARRTSSAIRSGPSASSIEIGVPERAESARRSTERAEDRSTVARIVLEQEMAQEEAEVEGRVAGVAHIRSRAGSGRRSAPGCSWG